MKKYARVLDLYELLEISRLSTDMIISHIEQLNVIYNNFIFQKAQFPSLASLIKKLNLIIFVEVILEMYD